MKKLFITGATGNIGKALLKHLNFELFEVILGVRNPETAKGILSAYNVKYCHFDFEKSVGFENVAACDLLFLLRPPHIGDVKRYVKPFLETIPASSIEHLVFLSVQGAEKKPYIPHSKIEKMIKEKGFSYTFVRPSYFLDNLTTTLYPELKENKRIYMPSGYLKFNWIDVDDVGEACARLFEYRDQYLNKALTLTNIKNQGFSEIVECINSICGGSIRYVSPSLLQFIIHMRKQGYSFGYIGIMLLLHFLPRFEKEPEVSGSLEQILGRLPKQIEDFVKRNIEMFSAIS